MAGLAAKTQTTAKKMDIFTQIAELSGYLDTFIVFVHKPNQTSATPLAQNCILHFHIQ